MNLNLIWASAVLKNPKFDTPEDVQQFVTAANLYLPDLTPDEIREMYLNELGELIRARAEGITEQVSAVTAIQNMLDENMTRTDAPPESVEENTDGANEK